MLGAIAPAVPASSLAVLGSGFCIAPLKQTNFAELPDTFFGHLACLLRHPNLIQSRLTAPAQQSRFASICPPFCSTALLEQPETSPIIRLVSLPNYAIAKPTRLSPSRAAQPALPRCTAAEHFALLSAFAPCFCYAAAKAVAAPCQAQPQCRIGCFADALCRRLRFS